MTPGLVVQCKVVTVDRKQGRIGLSLKVTFSTHSCVELGRRPLEAAEPIQSQLLTASFKATSSQSANPERCL